MSIKESVEKYGLTLTTRNGKECVVVMKNTEEAKKIFSELQSLNHEIIVYLKEQKAAEKKRYEVKRKQIEDGTLPIRVEEITHFVSALDQEVTENKIIGDMSALIDLFGIRYNGYYTHLAPGEYTISALPEWQVRHAKQVTRNEKFAKAKTTGKPVLLQETTGECNDSDEECSIDIVRVFAMPDGSTKTTRVHTY